ncbi:MAG: Na+/H+ antiporter subunit B [Myxococcota bacterium]
MNVILRAATRFVLPLLLLYSVVLLLRGHHHPGGGFAGGLVASAGFALHALAFDVAHTHRLVRVSARRLLGAGLLTALASGMLALFRGRAFLTSQWTTVRVPGLGAVELGTPMLFDLGVYLVVVGVTLLIVMTLMED